jgi:hypothetical protein
MALSVRIQLLLLTVLAGSTVMTQPLPKSLIMPWFCLQRCGANVSQIEAHVAGLAALNENGTLRTEAVAFERYNLGPNSTLVFNSDLYDLNSLLRANYSHVVKRRIAMISSFPYPPQFLTWMRQLFSNSSGFIAQLTKELVAHQIDGVNVDFEPTANATELDAVRYAQFLQRLKEKLGQAGKIVTVAAATWSNVWNLTLIAESLAATAASNHIPGYLTSMNTYTYNNTVFQRMLDLNLDIFNTVQSHVGKLVVGLETWPDKFTDDELAFHFELLANRSVCSIALWDAPIPLQMVAHLTNFSRRCGLVK